MLYYLEMHFQMEQPSIADEIVYKKITRNAVKGLEGKVVAKPDGKQKNDGPQAAQYKYHIINAVYLSILIFSNILHSFL